MSVHCDYCGLRLVEDGEIKVAFYGLRAGSGGPRVTYFHYHRGDCVQRVLGAIQPAQGTGPMDEIPVASPQKIAALRRKHGHSDDEREAE